MNLNDISGITTTEVATGFHLIETFDGYKFYIEHVPISSSYHFKQFENTDPFIAAHLTLRYKLHMRLNWHEY